MLCTVSARAQNATDSAVISGIVVDERHEPVWYAVVKIVSLDSVLTGQLTDTTGRFRLAIPARNLANTRLRADICGYQTGIVRLSSEKKQSIIAKLKPISIHCLGTIIQYRVPLVNPWGPTQRTFTSEEIEKMGR